MNQKQRTIKAPVTLSGVGLHTGATAHLTFKPAPVNHGYKFKRTDLEDQPVIDADCDLVTDTSRGTTLSKNGAKVHTTEHALAALSGMEIDNILMEIDGPEVPILDGSSRLYIEAFTKAGIQEQDADRVYYELKENLTFEDPARKIEMLAVPSEDFRVTVMVDYNSPVLGTQHAQLHKISEFKDEISMCRTFCFLHEIEQLFKHNLIKGGDVNNAIVVVDREISQEKLDELAVMFNKPKMEIKYKGFLNNVELHFQNEPARHKLLDIIGDFALIGTPVKAHVLAARPGHFANIEFAKKIKALIKRDKQHLKTQSFDLNKPSLYDINQISKMLPHRFPFLLLDKIIELSDRHVVGVKNVTMNEWFFQGHFPGNPVMPGVLQIEALAQCGGILAINLSGEGQYDTYFLKIDNCKFKQMVRPGDTLILKMELSAPIRRGICEMKGTTYVGNKVCAEADLVAQIVKR